MRLPRFPGLPVSRRRHEVEVERRRHREHVEWQEFHSRQARFWRERVAELEQAIREFVASEDTHEPGPFVKDGNWHTGPCVEGGPRMEDVYPDGFQVCADEECFAYWPCDVERLRRVLDGHGSQEPGRCNQHLGSETHGGPEQYCAAPRGHDGNCLDYVGGRR